MDNATCLGCLLCWFFCSTALYKNRWHCTKCSHTTSSSCPCYLLSPVVLPNPMGIWSRHTGLVMRDYANLLVHVHDATCLVWWSFCSLGHLEHCQTVFDVYYTWVQGLMVGLLGAYATYRQYNIVAFLWCKYVVNIVNTTILCLVLNYSSGWVWVCTV